MKIKSVMGEDVQQWTSLFLIDYYQQRLSSTILSELLDHRPGNVTLLKEVIKSFR